MKVEREKYFKLQQRIKDIPFVLSKEWHDMTSQGVEMVYYVSQTDDPRICCFGYVTKSRFLGKILRIEGVSMESDVNITELRNFYQSIVADRYDYIKLSDIWKYNPIFEVGLRRAGFIRPLGLSLCPMSLEIDFTRDFQFHRKWRSHVRKSVASGNTFYVVEKPIENDADDFRRMFMEQKERKSLGYCFSVNDLMLLLKGNYRLFFVKNKDGKNIAGRIVYVYNKHSYDITTANSYEGISTGAVYQLQQEMLEYLKSIEIRSFDYGRIPPTADYMDDIYIAKSYSGGSPIGYNGQWIFTKSVWKEYVMSAYLFLHKKIHIY